MSFVMRLLPFATGLMIAAVLPIVFVDDLDMFAVSAACYLVVFICINYLGVIKDEEERRIFLASYLFFTLLGLALLAHHFSFYRGPFDAYGDDASFFAWALHRKVDLFAQSYSIYERVLAVVLLAGDAVGLRSGVHLVLPLNWGVGAYTVVLSHRIAKRVASVPAPLGLLFAALLLNYSFTDNTVHLYRDIYVALLWCLIVLAAISGNYAQGYLHSFLVAFLRLPNGVLGFLVTSGRALFDSTKARTLLAVYAVMLIIPVVFFAYEENLRVQRYDIGHMDHMMEDRLTTYRDKTIQSGGGVGFVNSLALPVRFVLNIPAQLVRPIRINDFYAPVKERPRAGHVVNHRSIGFAVTTLSLVFLAGYYFNGLLLLWYSKSAEHRFFLATIVVVISMLGFVSFLDRHRTVLIVLFPTLVAMNFSPWAEQVRRSGRFLLIRAAVGVAFLVACLAASLW